MKKLSYSGLIIALLSVMQISMACVGSNPASTFMNDTIVIGSARIIPSASHLNKVCKGDIVVAHRTTASWESALCLAAGIITDSGDSNSHAALFGKRMGIPVIVGVGNATKVIDDGQVVIINCSNNSFYVEPAAGEDVTIAHYGAMHKATGHCVPHTHSTTTSSHLPTAASSAQKTVTVHQHGGQPGCNGGPVIKELYKKNCPDFKKYVLSLKSALSWGKFFHAVESGARLKGYNPFTIACIPIADSLFDRDEKYVVSMIESIVCDKDLNDIANGIERCKQKPGNIKWFDWIAQVSHEEHIKNVTLPVGIDRKKLMDHPEEYQKIIKQNKVSARECNAEIIKGLYFQYLVEKNLLFRS